MALIQRAKQLWDHHPECFRLDRPVKIFWFMLIVSLVGIPAGFVLWRTAGQPADRQSLGTAACQCWRWASLFFLAWLPGFIAGVHGIILCGKHSYYGGDVGRGRLIVLLEMKVGDRIPVSTFRFFFYLPPNS